MSGSLPMVGGNSIFERSGGWGEKQSANLIALFSKCNNLLQRMNIIVSVYDYAFHENLELMADRRQRADSVVVWTGESQEVFMFVA